MLKYLSSLALIRFETLGLPFCWKFVHFKTIYWRYWKFSHVKNWECCYILNHCFVLLFFFLNIYCCLICAEDDIQILLMWDGSFAYVFSIKKNYHNKNSKTQKTKQNKTEQNKNKTKQNKNHKMISDQWRYLKLKFTIYLVMSATTWLKHNRNNDGKKQT